jgi:hypothetical protein
MTLPMLAAYLVVADTDRVVYFRLVTVHRGCSGQCTLKGPSSANHKHEPHLDPRFTKGTKILQDLFQGLVMQKEKPL